MGVPGDCNRLHQDRSGHPPDHAGAPSPRAGVYGEAHGNSRYSSYRSSSVASISRPWRVRSQRKSQHCSIPLRWGRLKAPSRSDFLNSEWDVGTLEGDRPDPDELMQLIFTSGTTGEPKGVMHTANTMFANVVPFAARMNLIARDVGFSPTPLAHLLHLGRCANSPSVGADCDAAAWMQDDCDLGHDGGLCGDHGATG